MMRNKVLAIGLVSVLLLSSVMVGCGKQAQQNETASSDEPETKNVYLAGPFFNDEEIRNVEYVESVLEDHGFTYSAPCGTV